MPDRKIAAMHKEYGKAQGYKCGDCPWLYRVQSITGKFYECKAYGPTGPAASWARSWAACGLYRCGVYIGHVPLQDRLRRAKQPDNEPIEGQISMFEGW